VRSKTAYLEKGGYRINVICKRVERKGPFTSFDLMLQLNWGIRVSWFNFRALPTNLLHISMPAGDLRSE